ncbi:actin or actin-binding cytoskeletal protein [Lithospermum erythrorhizon]|uniref:Actin or actin-binding cytoskeletal protein n=1 Tax=Lithospermum erythrorhizon TaxID=34254 RepID=A0AAV3PFA8_LITER
MTRRTSKASCAPVPTTAESKTKLRGVRKTSPFEAEAVLENPPCFLEEERLSSEKKDYQTQGTHSFGVKWSPSGNTLAYVGHNSMIYFVNDVGPSPSAQSVALRDLPLCDVLFISEKVVIGVGFDCNPMVFFSRRNRLMASFDDVSSYTWPNSFSGTFLRFLGERRSASSGVKSGSQFSEAFGKFYGQSKNGSSNDETSKGHGVHNNCINCILPLKRAGDSSLFRFSTSGLDGKVAVWDLQGQEDLSEFL